MLSQHEQDLARLDNAIAAAMRDGQATREWWAGVWLAQECPWQAALAAELAKAQIARFVDRVDTLIALRELVERTVVVTRRTGFHADVPPRSLTGCFGPPVEYTVDEQLHDLDLLRENHIVRVYDRDLGDWDDLMEGRGPGQWPQSEAYDAVIRDGDTGQQMDTRTRVREFDSEVYTSQDEEQQRELTFEPCVLVKTRTHRTPAELDLAPNPLADLAARERIEADEREFDAWLDYAAQVVYCESLDRGELLIEAWDEDGVLVYSLLPDEAALVPEGGFSSERTVVGRAVDGLTCWFVPDTREWMAA